MHALCIGLFGEDAPLLKDLPGSGKPRGIGMSDEFYATTLRARFNYLNTFIDREPKLDILDEKDCKRYREQDFVISADVFEHIDLPVFQAFVNVAKMLKPRGVLVFTCPYIDAPVTIEHYPNLYDFEYVDALHHRILVNRTVTGRLEFFPDPVFHGGENAPLECRVLARADLLRMLRCAGFDSIREFSEPILNVGYYWPDNFYPTSAGRTFNWLGYVILAVRP